MPKSLRVESEQEVLNTLYLKASVSSGGQDTARSAASGGRDSAILQKFREMVPLKIETAELLRFE